MEVLLREQNNGILTLTLNRPEAINALTHDEKERQMLTHHMLGPMLVGGFVSVTMVSVVLAGILVGYLSPVSN